MEIIREKKTLQNSITALLGSVFTYNVQRIHTPHSCCSNRTVPRHRLVYLLYALRCYAAVKQYCNIMFTVFQLTNTQKTLTDYACHTCIGYCRIINIQINVV